MDWIEGFIQYTGKTNSPEIFRKWAAISVLAGALERRCWIKTSIGTLYPNVYIILVAGPGVGKSVAVRYARDFLLTLTNHHIAPSSVTKASLIDTLNDSLRHIVRPKENPASIMFNSLHIISSELGVLLPGYDTEFMHVLTDLYDCDTYSEKRRTAKLNIEIKNPQLNILAACTPDYLTGVMPEGAWAQGFASRLLMIYSGDTLLVDLFADEKEDAETKKALANELKKRAGLYGKYTFTPEAATLITNWREAGEPIKPDHPKLFHYNSRRTAHVLKLAMICAASESDELIIDERHMQRALDLLIEAEFFMPDIFKAMSGTTHGQLIEETWHFILKAYTKAGKEAVLKSRVVNFLQTRTPAHNVARVLEVMESSGIIRRELVKQGEAYRPMGREA
jgi:hypothetical protein